MNEIPAISNDLENKILQLQAAVQSRIPDMNSQLQIIWTALKQQPENVTLLSEEQIQIIVSGLEVQTNNKLVEITLKDKKGSAKLKNLTADDI